MNLPLIIIGAGGHAKVLIGSLRSANAPVLGLTDADPVKRGTTVMGISVLGDDSLISEHRPGTVLLVNGIGSIDRPIKRAGVFEQFKRKGYTFATVVHPSAVVATDIVLPEGVQMMAGAVIQPSTSFGSNVIVNTRASVDHDCLIGDHVHIAPGATISGGVRIGAGTFIGAGATVVQGITIGCGCLVAAGAVVVTDIRDGASVRGVPAEEFMRND